MGLAISVVEIPILAIYAATLAFLQVFYPKKNFSGRCNEPEEATIIYDEEWIEDSFKPGTTHVIEGSSKDDQSVYIEVNVHEKHASATVVISKDGKCFGGQFNGPFLDSKTIQCGPLFMEMRLPFRRWRVSFKGYLSCEDASKFVTVSGWWKPTSDARYFYSDINFSSCYFTKPLEISANLEKLSNAHYSNDLSQFGQLHLEVGIDGSTEDVRYKGIRQQSDSTKTDASDEFHVYLEDGNRISFKSVEQESHTVTVNHGYIMRGDSSFTGLSLDDVTSLEESSHKLLDFKPHGCSTLFGVLPYELRKGDTLNSYNYTSSCGKLVEIKHIRVNHALNNGIALVRRVRESLTEVEEPEFNTLPEVTASACETQRFVVPFSLHSCQDKHFTGGKGANLSRLKSIENKFTVPIGAVVTTTAFDSFVQQNDKLQKLLKSSPVRLEDCVAIGEEIATILNTMEPPIHLVSDLEEAGILRNSDVKHAVRSSAVGEDGSDLSSAGQLESVLNVNYEDIPEKILECWCSNFRKEAISYRRNYGQLLYPSMAVVVQEMVSNGVAGVMFTCDPVKNDDGKIVINAIFGSGEDIVSGVVTPDEIIVEKRNMLNIHKPENCCVDNGTIEHLAQVGLFLEGMFGTSQDVEFVLRDGKVFIVQSRDVTGQDRETRFELLTEFDDAALTDREVFTTANVGEVVPVPMTPFEISTFTDSYNKTMTNMVLRDIGDCYIPRHHTTSFFMHGQRILFGIGAMFMRQWELIMKDRLAEISIAGGLVFNDTMFGEAQQRYKPLPKMFHIRRLYLIADLLFSKSYKILKDILEHRKETEALTPRGEATFETLVSVFEKQRKIFRQILGEHSDASMFSSFTYIVVGMLIRGSDEGGMDPETLSDFSNIFSNSTTSVLSADVPAALKNLAKAIRDDGLREEFCEADEQKALAILKEKGKESATQLTSFLETHGHRGPKELYLRSNGWGEKPELLIVTLKAMLSSDLEEKDIKQKSIDDVVDSLKCAPKGIRRWMMKYMVGQSHRGVACREFAKSCLVKSVFELRATAKIIAKHVYNKGLLPDEDLMFFMTGDELKHLYHTRSPRVIARAMRRRQIFGDLEERRYAHIYHGNPEPINTETMLATSDVSLSGTVVCEGRVVARARVAANLEEAKLTQPGEILITRCTDICWSPFFPIIKGIVTEIGGLLSHGAVVAREYGLPSIIAVENATAVFKTGDLVELDSFKGVISKIEESSE